MGHFLIPGAYALEEQRGALPDKSNLYCKRIDIESAGGSLSTDHRFIGTRLTCLA